MLLHWRDELRVLLTPGRVYARIRGRGRGQTVLDEAIEVPNNDVFHWHEAVQALSCLLQDKRCRDTQVDIVLSNHFVRYCVVPVSDLLVTRDDQLRFAKHHFARVHGALADSWSVRVSGSPGRTVVASAIDGELIETLCTQLLSRGTRPRSLQPLLMASFNEVRAQLPGGELRLLIIEPEMAVSALLNGDWQRIRSQRTGGATDDELDRLIARERALDDRVIEQEAVFAIPLAPHLIQGRRNNSSHLHVLRPFWPEVKKPAVKKAEVPA